MAISDPTCPEPRRLSILLPRPLWIGVATGMLAFALQSAGFADSYNLYDDRRITDSLATYYVVVHNGAQSDFDARFAGPVEVTFAKAAKGAPPINSVLASSPVRLDSRAEARKRAVLQGVCVRQGDQVLGNTSVPFLPSDILVTHGAPGFVLLNPRAYGDPKTGEAIRVYDQHCRLKFTWRAAEIFPDTHFERFGSSTVWFRTAWCDDEKREVIVIASGGKMHIARIGLDTGIVVPGDEADVKRAINTRNRTGLEAAIELANEHQLSGVTEELRQIFRDPKERVSARVRAVVTLHRTGERITAADVLELSRRSTGHSYCDVALRYSIGESRDIIIDEIPAFLGQAGKAVLGQIVRRDGGSVSTTEAFTKYGRQAGSEILGFLDSTDPEVVCFGIELVIDVGVDREELVPKLIELLESRKVSRRGHSIRTCAARALRSLGKRAAIALEPLQRCVSTSKCAEIEAADRERPPESFFLKKGPPPLSDEAFESEVCKAIVEIRRVSSSK